MSGRTVQKFMGKALTRREVLIAREAYGTGATHQVMYGFSGSAARARAADEEFPLPKVTRPRVVGDPHERLYIEWTTRVINGVREPVWRDNRLKWDDNPDGWVSWVNLLLHVRKPAVTPERFALLADLLANPDETVEDTAL